MLFHLQSYDQLETTGFTHVVLAFGKINATYDVIQADSWGDPAVGH